MIIERSKVRGILDELVSNSMRAKAKKITITIEELTEEVRITVEDNGTGMDAEMVKEVSDRLNAERRSELDAYYGELAGETHAGTGLSLVGMMVNRAEVSSQPGVGTTIAVYRRKHGSRR